MTQNSPILQFIINPIPPVWDFLNNSWVPQMPRGIGTRSVTNILTTGPPVSIGPYINSGYGNLNPVNYSSCGLASWLQLIQDFSSFTIEGSAVNAGAINISLVILN
jgi:hypothetical protein